MTDGTPWDKISVPEKDFNVLSVSEKTPVSCFWGRDAGGACLFIVKLVGDYKSQYREQALAIHGIDIDLRQSGKREQHLVLTLERQVDRDLFASLCKILIASLENASDSLSSLSILLAHMRRWKTFMAGRNGYLSSAEVQGLFAELTFLRELIANKMPVNNAVASWLGAEKSQQDFIFGNTALEIKSLSGIERNSVRISSEDQLESLNDDLFLRIYRLSTLRDNPKALSLNALIRALYDLADDAESVEMLNQKLAAYGYAPLPVYDQPHFVVNEVRHYRVDDNFPKLQRSKLPSGIARVTYDILLEAIEEFKCDSDIIFKGR